MGEEVCGVRRCVWVRRVYRGEEISVGEKGVYGMDENRGEGRRGA